MGPRPEPASWPEASVGVCAPTTSGERVGGAGCAGQVSGVRGSRGGRFGGVVVAAWMAVAGCEGGGEGGEGAPAASSRPTAPTAPRLGPPSAPVSRIESADVWLDLIAQRPSAVTTQAGRLVVDLGHLQARKHVDLAGSSPWRLAAEVEGVSAGIVVGQGAALDLPVDGALAPGLHPEVEGKGGLAMALTLRAFAPGQSVTVLWQEQPLAHLTIGTSWERRTFSLPAKALVAGDNRLRLHFKRVSEVGGESVSAAVRSVEVGPREAIVAGPPSGGRAPYQVDDRDPEHTRMILSSGTGLAYYVRPPRRARLRVEARGRGSLTVLASTDEDHAAGRPPTELLAEPLRAAGKRHEIDLSGYGGMPLRIEVRAQSADEGAAEIQELAIVSPRAIPVDRRQRGQRDLYVLALEGARPDDLIGAGHDRVHFPAFERLAGEALIFDRAYALAPWAVPTHASWLSGVSLPVHKTIRGTFVADTHVMLAEVLARGGYAPVAVSADPDFADPAADRGLGQGFERVSTLVRSPSQRSDAVAVVAAALAEAQARPSPRFAYAVVNDPQLPYEPPREFQGEGARPEEAPLPHLTHLWVGRVRTGKVTPTKAQLAYVRRLYRGELQVVDAALGELFTALEAAGTLDSSMIVVVGVHGQEFFEHGGGGHGHSLHEEVLRVPLAIRAPDLLAAGRVSTPVDVLDLAPTIVDLLGLPFPSEWQGESLLPVIDDPQPPPRLVTAYLGDGARAAIVGDAKLVIGSGRGLEAQHFFDLGSDPGETRDRLAEGGIALRIARTALAWESGEEGRWRRARWGNGADLRPAFARDRGM